MVDFDGFKHIIDVMGGVDVDVEKYMEDECWLNDNRLVRESNLAGNI
jgi:anionic cell wall polymer biosynthesis LytR-Cps2A-Psr (LCP) family protein